MPYELTYLENNGILLKGTGVITGSELAAFNREFYATPEKIRSISFQVCDFTNVESIDFTSDEVRALAVDDNRAARFNPHMLIAIVSEKDLAYGLARMWEAHIKEPSLETAVFRTVEEAMHWIAFRMKGRKPKNEIEPETDKPHR